MVIRWETNRLVSIEALLYLEINFNDFRRVAKQSHFLTLWPICWEGQARKTSQSNVVMGLHAIEICLSKRLEGEAEFHISDLNYCCGFHRISKSNG
jgi:hypothetical protein